MEVYDNMGLKVYELMANLLIVLIAAMAIMRGFELIVRSPSSLEAASNIYIAIGSVMDLQTFGSLLVLSASILLTSVFFRGAVSYVMMVMGALGVGFLHVLYGMASSESAKLVATYYTTTTIGIFAFIVATIGGVALWQIFKKKK